MTAMNAPPRVPTRARPARPPGFCLKLAAVGSLALGMLVVQGLPVLLGAASYVGLLAGTLALCAVAGGVRLWLHDTLLTRASVALAVVPVLVGVVLAFLLGLPGASEVDTLGVLGPAGVLALSAGVLGLLTTDALRRTTDQGPNRPYAL